MTKTKINSIIDLINWGNKHFSQNGIENSKLEMEWLLCHTLKCKRIDLYINFENHLQEPLLTNLRKMVKRRLSGEPFQHIIGKSNFYGRDFIVNKNVFIPRSETEIIIDRLKINGKVNTLLDIGTGSGCIGITSLLEGFANNVYATDISKLAINTAKKNMNELKAKNIHFFVHDFLLSDFTFKSDTIVSNPPYIPNNELSSLQTEVKNYDPHDALTDYNDGLTFYRRFANQFDNIVNPGGNLILEFGGNNQKNEIEGIFNKGGFRTSFFKDLHGEWRIIEVRK